MQNDYVELTEKVKNEMDISVKGCSAVLKTGAVAAAADIAYVLESKVFYGNDHFDQALVAAEMGAIGAVGTMATAITVICGAYTLFHEVKGLILSHKRNKIMQKEKED